MYSTPVGSCRTKRLIAFCVLWWVAASAAFGAELMISAGVGMAADARAGVELRFSKQAALQAHLGASLAHAVTGDLLGVWRLFAPTERTSVRLLAGASDLLVPLTAQAVMVSFGLAFEGRWWISKQVAVCLRVGEGYPLFIENGVPTMRAVRYPLGLWPDLLLSVLIRPRANTRE